MDSNPDSDSSIHGTEAAAFRSSSTTSASPNHNDPQYERGPGTKVFGIWHHGGERRRTDNGSFDRYWRCGHCKGRNPLRVAEHVGGATSYAIRHLRNKHNIDIRADEMAIPLQLPHHVLRDYFLMGKYTLHHDL